MGVSKAVQASAGFAFCSMPNALAPRCLTAVVSCDMKLQSVLLGWTRVLTKSCVCPQVLHGSMRLMGGERVLAIVRGMKPSR